MWQFNPQGVVHEKRSSKSKHSGRWMIIKSVSIVNRVGEGGANIQSEPVRLHALICGDHFQKYIILHLECNLNLKSYSESCK